MLAKLVCFALATASASGYIPAAQGVHAGITCDGSGMSPIVAARDHLPGRDYDLCESEFSGSTPRRAARSSPSQPPGGADRRRRALSARSRAAARARRAGEAPGVVPRRVTRAARRAGCRGTPRRRRASGDYSAAASAARATTSSTGTASTPAGVRRGAPGVDVVVHEAAFPRRATTSRRWSRSTSGPDRPNKRRARRLATARRSASSSNSRG